MNRMRDRFWHSRKLNHTNGLRFHKLGTSQNWSLLDVRTSSSQIPSWRYKFIVFGIIFIKWSWTYHKVCDRENRINNLVKFIPSMNPGHVQQIYIVADDDYWEFYFAQLEHDNSWEFYFIQFSLAQVGTFLFTFQKRFSSMQCLFVMWYLNSVTVQQLHFEIFKFVWIRFKIGWKSDKF